MPKNQPVLEEAPSTEKAESENEDLTEEESVEKDGHRHNEKDGGHSYSLDTLLLGNEALYYEKNGGILRFDTETEEKTTLCEKGELLAVKEEWVYYLEGSALMAMQEGKVPAKLTECTNCSFTESGKNLFLNVGNTYFLVKGTELQKVLEGEVCSRISLKDNCLYWVRLSPTRALCKTDLSDGTTQELGELPYGGGKPRLEWSGEQLYYFQSNGLYRYTQAQGLKLVKSYENGNLCYFANGYAYVYNETPRDALLEVIDLSTEETLRSEKIIPKGIACFEPLGIAYCTEDWETLVKETPQKEFITFSLKDFKHIHKVYPLKNGYCVQAADPDGCYLCGDSSFTLITIKNGELTTTTF